VLSVSHVSTIGLGGKSTDFLDVLSQRVLDAEEGAANLAMNVAISFLHASGHVLLELFEAGEALAALGAIVLDLVDWSLHFQCRRRCRLWW
jgi:hypothetical protein